MSELDRLRSTLGHKWNKHGPDVLPAFVADMDFPPDPRIGQAIVDLVDRGDLGYCFHFLDELPEAWQAWQKRRHGIDLRPVGMPGHVLLASGPEPTEFYDPFAGGAVLVTRSRRAEQA